jgi:hypothetical protein
MKLKLTDEKWDWIEIFWGMLGDGCSKNEALAYLLVMDCPKEIYSWLVKEIARSRKSATQ